MLHYGQSDDGYSLPSFPQSSLSVLLPVTKDPTEPFFQNLWCKSGGKE